MINSFDLKFAVQLVANGNDSDGFLATNGVQTGDLLGVFVPALLMITAFAALAFLLYRNCQAKFAVGYKKSKYANVSFIKQPLLKSKINLILILSSIFLLITSVVLFAITTTGKAFAVDNQISTPVVCANVGDDGSISPVNVHIKNTKGTQLKVQSTSVDLNGKAWSSENFQNSNFSLVGLGGTLFDGPPDGGLQVNDSAFNRIKDENYGDFVFSIGNLDAQTALANVGQIVYVCCITFEDAVVPFPIAKENLTYNGKKQIGVDEAPQYVLIDNLKQDASDSYVAKATLKPGFIWEDESTNDYSVNWNIKPSKLSLTTESNWWLKDGLSHTWPFGKLLGFQTTFDSETQAEAEEWAKLDVYAKIQADEQNVRNDAKIQWDFPIEEVPAGKIPAKEANYILSDDDYNPGWLRIILGGKEVDVQWPEIQEYSYNGAQIEGPVPQITYEGEPIDAEPIFEYYDYFGNLVEGMPVNAGVYTKKIIAFKRDGEIITDYSLPGNSAQIMYIKKLSVSADFMQATLTQYEYDYTGKPVTPDIDVVSDERLDVSTGKIVSPSEYSVVAIPQTERGIYYISLVFNGNGNYENGTLQSLPWAITRNVYLSFSTQKPEAPLSNISKVEDKDGKQLPNWDPYLDPYCKQPAQAKFGEQYVVTPDWENIEKGKSYTLYMFYYNQDSDGIMTDLFVDFKTTTDDTLTFTFSQNTDICMIFCSESFSQDVTFPSDNESTKDFCSFTYNVFESGKEKLYNEDPTISLPMFTLVSVSPTDNKTLLFSGLDYVPWASLTIDDTTAQKEHNLSFDKWNIEPEFPGILPDGYDIVFFGNDITYSLVSKDYHKVFLDDSSMKDVDVFYQSDDEYSFNGVHVVQNGEYVLKGTQLYIGSKSIAYENVNLLANDQIVGKFSKTQVPGFGSEYKVAVGPLTMGEINIKLSCAYPEEWNLFTYYSDSFNNFKLFYKVQSDEEYIPIEKPCYMPAGSEIIAVTDIEAFANTSYVKFSYSEGSVEKIVSGKIINEDTTIDGVTYKCRYKIEGVADGWFEMPKSDVVMDWQLDSEYRIVRFNENEESFLRGAKLFYKKDSKVDQLHDWGIVPVGASLAFGFDNLIKDSEMPVPPEYLLKYHIAISVDGRISSFASINKYSTPIGWDDTNFSDLIRCETFTMPDKDITLILQEEEKHTLTLDESLKDTNNITVAYKYYYKEYNYWIGREEYYSDVVQVYDTAFIPKGVSLCVMFNDDTYNDKYIKVKSGGTHIASYQISNLGPLGDDWGWCKNKENRCQEFMMEDSDITLELSDSSSLNEVEIDNSIWEASGNVTNATFVSNVYKKGSNVSSGDYVPMNSQIAITFDNADVLGKYIVLENGISPKSYKISDFIQIPWVSDSYCSQAIISNVSSDIKVRLSDTVEGELVYNEISSNESVSQSENEVILNDQLLFDNNTNFVPSVKKDNDYFISM